MYLELDTDRYLNRSETHVHRLWKLLEQSFLTFSNALFVRWNQLDVAIVFLSVVGIVLEELKSDMMPINPTIMRVMRVLRIARGTSVYSSLRAFVML
mgnify:FL=1